MKTAIVLSGGGAKGAYQIGVWKALRRLHIKYQIVTGTSVGALNGVLMVQNSYFTAKKIWNNITYADVLGKEFEDKIIDKKTLDVYKEYAKTFFSDGGIDGKELEQLFGKYINSRRFFHANKNYGIITFNSTTMHPLEVTKANMNNENLKDYVLASASCYPAFKPKMIDNQKYIDGGFYDNLPINLAINLGATRVIAIDLRAPGIKRNVVDKSVEVIRIYPKNKLSSFLVFDKYLSRRAIALGYNDTMKTFNKLEGNKYTFRKGMLSKNYLKYKVEMINLIKKLSDRDDLIFNAISNFNEINMILNNKDFSKLTNNIVEYLGEVYGIDDSKIYSSKSFNSELLYEFETISNFLKPNDRNLSDTKQVILYIYNLLTDEKIEIKKLCKSMIMFKKEFMGALYIAILEQ